MIVICCLLHCQLQGTQLNIVLLATAGPGDGIEDTVIRPEGRGEGQWNVLSLEMFQCSPDTVTGQLESPVHGEEDGAVQNTWLIVPPGIKLSRKDDRAIKRIPGIY
jgi:hypothetical protein